MKMAQFFALMVALMSPSMAHASTWSVVDFQLKSRFLVLADVSSISENLGKRRIWSETITDDKSQPVRKFITLSDVDCSSNHVSVIQSTAYDWQENPTDFSMAAYYAIPDSPGMTLANVACGRTSQYTSIPVDNPDASVTYILNRLDVAMHNRQK